ncbi:MAG: tRNA 4-thiouridine(8) synthase ThiI [Spirochaetes bacterium]|nr:tRNA 4-thiouridine(8) synthase ThiI [Spirochaetota bacterium]
MDIIYLLKLGEIHLKGENRKQFIELLRVNLRRRLEAIPHKLIVRDGRFFLYAPDSYDADVSSILNRLPGINGWARSKATAKDLPAIIAAALEVYKNRLDQGFVSFKVESRRADKGFALDSYALSRELGHEICEKYPQAKVDVHTPDTVINVEVREQVYVYADSESGVRGLPVGCAGKGLLLLSGGIDSPVAGFHMLRRGLALENLYFNAYPYTSHEAWEKVKSLAEVVAGYGGPMQLHTLHFTEIQLKIKKDAAANCSTLYFRAAMMLSADRLCKQRRLNSIVTGESLSQVASQTAENMRFSQSYTDMAVLRPLCGTDKEDIIRTARKIGTYEISILPYEDCCVLFSPKYPVIKADFEQERRSFDRLNLGPMIEEALASCETITVQPKTSGCKA